MKRPSKTTKMYLVERARQLFSSMSQEANNYHGLLNQGSTCYLNSVLQVLFMTKDFREAVRRFSDGNPHTEVIDHQLKALFDDLEKRTASTYNITKKLGINNVHEQRDAAEYFERVLRQTSSEASKIFHGLLTNRITCQQCLKQTDTDAPFWHLPLSLVDSCSDDYRVVNAIEEFFRPSVLSGENQMYCEECDVKADATLTDVIKDHPEVLILLLKRFEFSYNHRSYIKISCSVEVPYRLQIPESHTYELYAVVDHSGNLRSGHYTATIRIQDDGDRWVKFDDTRVTQADKKLFKEDHTERSQTAYILFYRKKEKKEKKRKRKRKREEDETTAELCNDPVKVIFTGEDKDETEMIRPECEAAEESLLLRMKVDHSESEVHVETFRNGGTGVKELDHKERVQDGNTGVDDVRQSRLRNRVPEKLSSSATAHKEAEKQRKGDPEHIQTRGNSSLRRLGSQGGERPTVTQEAGSNEKIRAGSSQSDVRAVKIVTEGELRSQKSQPQITDDKIRQKTSKRSFNKGETNTKDSVDTLSSSVHSLTLKESTLPEKQEQGTKKNKQKDNEIIHFGAASLRKFSLEIDVPFMKKRQKKKLSFSLKRLEGKKKGHSDESAKPKKSAGCFPCTSPGSDSN